MARRTTFPLQEMSKFYLLDSGDETIENFRLLQKEGMICLDGDFFPSVHYPPITMYPLIKEEELLNGYQNPEDGLFDVYVHIPFCINQCVFCHYPVRVSELESEKDQYLSMLEREMDIYMSRLGIRAIKTRSILVGGGTPTFLKPAQLDRFLAFFTSKLDRTSCTQFNYDLDPSTLLGPDGLERIRILRSYGVDRLTIGIQSLDDDILSAVNRAHNAKDAVNAIERALENGFIVNIEFIYGLPGQTLSDWMQVLEHAISFDVDEIQIYRLKVQAYGDRQGPIKKFLERNPAGFPSVEQTLLMKHNAIRFLAQNGYNENLRRVYSKDPKIFSHYAHNQCCELYDEIGFGFTAFSSLRDRFGLNTLDWKEYYTSIKEGRLPLNRGLVRNTDDQLRWALVLPLKNRSVIKKAYQRDTGRSLDTVFRTKIEKLKSFGLLLENEKRLQLTELGSFFADEVCQQFHHPDHMPFSETAYARGTLHPYAHANP